MQKDNTNFWRQSKSWLNMFVMQRHLTEECKLLAAPMWCKRTTQILAAIKIAIEQNPVMQQHFSWRELMPAPNAIWDNANFGGNQNSRVERNFAMVSVNPNPRGLKLLASTECDARTIARILAVQNSWIEAKESRAATFDPAGWN